MTNLKNLVRAVIILSLALWLPSALAVDLSFGKREVKRTGAGEQVVQPVTIANTINSYTLTWDATTSPDKPGEITSGQWGWTVGYIPLGMTAPSRPNWYYQAFFNWYFDDEALHTRPATWRVIRGYGSDAMIEFEWNTPVVRAWVRFAMVEGSDKLLMFGGYEPKRKIEKSYLRFVCYPAFSPKPRQRAVTTAGGTRRPGESIELDLEAERWVLYEDTSEGRPGQGSAGMIVGTPKAFRAVTIPVGGYGIETRLELAPGGQPWAVALYDFPPLPEYQLTRGYFSRMGDAEAAALQRIAAGDLDRPLGEMPRDEERIARILRRGKEMFDRPAETWRPNPDALDFPWAGKLPGEPIKTVLFCQRWKAWEAMELARRLELDVDHLYFDARDQLSYTRAWPYASTTGIGPIPFGVASVRANAMVSRDDTELYISAGLYTRAIPGVTRIKIMEQVAKGKGLLMSGAGGVLADWPKELFATPDRALADRILTGIDWRAIPGLGDGEPGRAGARPPVRAWRYGRGRVVMLDVGLNHYGCLSVRNAETEGIMGAMGRMLALSARAAMFAAGRAPRCEIAPSLDRLGQRVVPVSATPAPPTGSVLRWRVQDDLERVVAGGEVKNPGAAARISLPAIPPSRRCWLDAGVYDAKGRCMGFTFAGLPAAKGPNVSDITIKPSTLTHELSVPWVKMPKGGELRCSARVANAAGLTGASAKWEVRDAFGRVLARATTPVPAGGGPMRATLPISRPMTVCHMLDVALKQGDETLDFARRRFTNPPPYPYGDFTGLMWTTCGGSPNLRVTDRLCYEWGADMCDPANVLRADDARAARESALTARSGMRLVPYVTRVFTRNVDNNVRKPCLHDPKYIAEQREWLVNNARQAAPYAPAAYTLGDENALAYSRCGELCYGEHTLANFRKWLRRKYGSVGRLNEVWKSRYGRLDEAAPPLIDEAAKRDGNWAAWFDHKVFMDQAFAQTHDWMRETIREQDPGAKVGWDGLLGYHWKAGYDFDLLSRNCDLNQVYVSQWVQGELVRSFAKPGALVGKWGNRVANNEAGWTAYPWHCLFDGCNSAWWWTSWGCDYVPFNPDISQSLFGKWFFRALREVASGPGKLLVRARRDDSGVAALFSQRDVFAAALARKMMGGRSFTSERMLLREHEGMLRAVTDAGRQFTYVTLEDLVGGAVAFDRYRVLILSLATCLSDRETEAIRKFVRSGGTLIVDGRAGYLDGNGNIRERRALDDVLGVVGQPGVAGFSRADATGDTTVAGRMAGVAGDRALELAAFEVTVLEPGLTLTTGKALAEVGGAPALISNRFGKGVAVTLNLAMHPLLENRNEEGPHPYLAIVEAALAGAGVGPYCEATRKNGPRPLCVAQMLFHDGAARYLCIEQDLLQYDLPDQPGHIKLPEPAIVYDVRAGRRIGQGRTREWDITFSRCDPHVYALLPYEVTGVSVRAPASAERGETMPVAVSVATSARPVCCHVVRMAVFAPGSNAPHRQYSQNITCERGAGKTAIPFAFNDAKGKWRLELRDAATGVRARAIVAVK